MLIRSVRHKGLRRLFLSDDPAGRPPAYIAKIQRMLSFLESAADVGELKSIPAWHAHMLTGDRKGTWTLHVSANWRLTFGVDLEASEIIDLDLEDYH